MCPRMCCGFGKASFRRSSGIKMLLHDDGLTIRGVQKMLKEDGVKKISALSPPLDMPSEEEGAARRTARRARRKARIDQRSINDDAAAPVHDAEAPSPVDDGPEAPFLHVEETEPAARGEDNVVSFQAQATDGAEPIVETTALEDADRADGTDDLTTTPDDIAPQADPTTKRASPSDIPADPSPSSGVPSAEQQNAIALLKRLRGLEVSTHLAEGSESALGTLHTRLVALRDRMSAESAAR